jgi:hypothetical protein
VLPAAPSPEDWSVPATPRPSVGPHTLDDQDDDVPFVPPRPLHSDPVPYGTHQDDLLPESDKRGRRPR